MDGTQPEQIDPEAAQFIKCRGMRFPKHKDIIQGRVRRLLRTHEYEKKETECALRTVREGDTVIELGAGIGYMSTLVASKRKIKSVHAFEANPLLIPYIQKVHAANGLTNAHVVHGILGPRKGTADFYVRHNLLMSSLSLMPDETERPSTKVPVHNAKQVFAEIKPNVLICDIEGAEVDLIPQLDLSNLRAAIIEMHPQWIGTEGVNKIFQCFMDVGLAYYHRGSMNKVVAFRNRW